MLKYITLYITILAGFVSFPLAALASSQVGVYVLHSNSTTDSRCVEIDTSTILGRDLLDRSGLKPVFDNGFLVELDGEKSQSAWQSRSGDNFWYSYILDSHSWQEVHAGASALKLKPGQIYGWQNYAGASILPKISFESVCPKPKASPTAKQSSFADRTEVAESIRPEISSEISNVATVASQIAKQGFKTPSALAQDTPITAPGRSLAGGAVLPANTSRPDDFRYILIAVAAAGGAVGFIYSRLHFLRRKHRRHDKQEH